MVGVLGQRGVNVFLLVMFLIIVLGVYVNAQDGYEYDDIYTNASWIDTDGTIQLHTFVPADDVDYVKFNATIGAKYIIQTSDLRNGSDTMLTLYDTDGTTQLDFNDDIVNGIIRRSKITWTANGTGTYYVNATDWAGASGGIYNLSVLEMPVVNLTLVTPSSNTDVQKGNLFNVTINVTCAGVDCNNLNIYLDPKQQKPKKAQISANSVNLLDKIDELPDEEFDVIIVLKDISNEEGVEDKFQAASVKKKGLGKKLEKRKDAVNAKQEKVLSKLGVSKSKGFSTASSKFSLKRKYNVINAISGRVSKQGLEDLKNDPNVESVELEQTFTAFLDNSTKNINADDVWATQLNGINITGTGQAVCILDTGVAYSHPDFGGYGNFPNAKVVAGYDFVNDDDDPADDNGHGSHVAGTAVSENETYRGVAPGAKLVAMKVLDASGNGVSSDIIAAIDYCVYHAEEFNISVISMSLGCEGGACTHYNSTNQASCDALPTSRAVNYAYGLGFVVTAASGNSGWTDGITNPACASGALSVGSVSKSDIAASSSCIGNTLDVFAPGVSIVATDHDSSPSLHRSDSGTSMATPHVAGAAALLNQYFNLHDGIRYHADDIIGALTSTGADISDHGYTKPRIDILAALNQPIHKGVISTTVGATPFYTTSANPNITTITAGNSQLVMWTVNATGDYGTYSFFAFVDTGDDSEIESNQVNLTIIDQTNPGVNLESPANATATNNQSIDFIFNVSDSLDNALNCSLYINNQLNETNTSVAKHVSTVFSKTLADGSYSWNVSCNDSYGNVNWSETRTLIVDTVFPVYIGYNTSATQVNADSNLTIWANWTESNPSIAVLTVNSADNDSTALVAQTSFVWTAPVSLAETYVNFTIRVNDTAGNQNETPMMSVFVKDSAEPVLDLQSPANNTWINSTNLTLVFNVSDVSSAIENCSLYFDSTLNQTNTSLVEGNNQFSVAAAAGSHTWYVVCYDNSSNNNAATSSTWIVKIAKQTAGTGINFQNTTNGTNTQNYTSTVDTELEIAINTTVTGNLTVTHYSLQPNFVISTLSNAVKYIDIELSDNVDTVLDWILIKVYYTAAEVSSLDESTLNLKWYNETSNTWTALSAGTPAWVNAVGVDTTNNYVWANVSHLSLYGLTGSTPSTPSSPGGGGGGGSSTSSTLQVTPVIDPTLATVKKNYKINVFYEGSAYSLKVSDVTSDYVKLNHGSYYYTINQGEKNIIGLKELWANDIYVGVNSIEEKEAVLSIYLYQEPQRSFTPITIPEKKVKVEEPEEEVFETAVEEKIVSEPKVNGAAVAAENVKNEETMFWQIKRFKAIIGAVVVVIALVIITSLIIRGSGGKKFKVLKKRIKEINNEVKHETEVFERNKRLFK